MEITVEQIKEAVNQNPSLIDGILPIVSESESGKAMIQNRVDIVYREKIGEEIKKVHNQYDEDVFSVLGQRPGTDESGGKQKTYDFLKGVYSELKDLRGKKESLSTDGRVKELESEIEKIKSQGGGSHIQSLFDSAKSVWETEKSGFIQQISDSKSENEKFQKMTEIKSAIGQLKFSQETPESIKKMVIDNAESILLKTSKLEGGKLVFLDGEGKPIVDSTTYSPKTALQMVSSLDAVKDILFKEGSKGGGADVEIKGSIQTTTVEGKDAQKLILPEGSFKTKQEFVQVAEKALLDSGITRRDANWDLLKNQAYKEHNVANLPFS